MSAAWAQERLGHLLAPIERAEPVDPSRMYRLLGARWYAQGLFVKDERSGQNIKANALYRVKAGDFVYNRLFAWKGSFAIADDDADDCHVSNEFPCFSVNRDRLDPSYLKWWFSRESSWLRALGLSTGATPTSRNRLKEVHLLGMEIPLPPLDEQRRIVARIEELATKVEEARTHRAQAIEHQAAFIKGVIGSHFKRLGASYPIRTFGSCNAHVSSGPRNWGKHYAAGGMRFYRAQDIDRDFQISHETVAFVEPPPGAQGRSAIVSNGDLLIVITGATVGRVAVYDSSHSPGLVSQHVAVCRIPPEHFLPKFAWWGLRSPDGQEQLLGSRYGQGKPGLNLDQVRALSLPCPPITVQEQVVAELEALQANVDAVKALQAQTADELDAMLPAILDKAFKGEL